MERENTWEPLPADLPTDWQTGQTVAPTGEEAGLSAKHGYNYLMEQVNAAQRAVNEARAAVEEHFAASNPHHLTAADVGARPDTWTPTAQEVGAISKNGGEISGNFKINGGDIEISSVFPINITNPGLSSPISMRGLNENLFKRALRKETDFTSTDAVEFYLLPNCAITIAAIYVKGPDTEISYFTFKFGTKTISLTSTNIGTYYYFTFFHFESTCSMIAPDGTIIASENGKFYISSQSGTGKYKVVITELS